MAVEGDLVVGRVAPRRVFVLGAQIHPPAEFDASAQPDAVTLQPRHRQAAVGCQ